MPKGRWSVYRGLEAWTAGGTERREFLVDRLEGHMSGVLELRFCTFDRLKRPLFREFPGGPEVRTHCFHCHGPGCNPQLGTKILQRMAKNKDLSPKKLGAMKLKSQRSIQGSLGESSRCKKMGEKEG